MEAVFDWRAYWQKISTEDGKRTLMRRDSIKELLEAGKASYSEAGIQEYLLDAWLLLEHVFQVIWEPGILSMKMKL